MRVAFSAIVGNRLQLRAKPLELGQVVQLRMADRRIERALALATGIHIPAAQTSLQQTLAPVFIAV